MRHCGEIGKWLVEGWRGRDWLEYEQKMQMGLLGAFQDGIALDSAADATVLDSWKDGCGVPGEGGARLVPDIKNHEDVGVGGTCQNSGTFNQILARDPAGGKAQRAGLAEMSLALKNGNVAQELTNSLIGTVSSSTARELENERTREMLEVVRGASSGARPKSLGW